MYNPKDVYAKMEAIEDACLSLQTARDNMIALNAGDFCSEELGGIGYNSRVDMQESTAKLYKAVGELNTLLTSAHGMTGGVLRFNLKAYCVAPNL